VYTQENARKKSWQERWATVKWAHWLAKLKLGSKGNLSLRFPINPTDPQSEKLQLERAIQQRREWEKKHVIWRTSGCGTRPDKTTKRDLGNRGAKSRRRIGKASVVLVYRPTDPQET